MPAPWKKSYEQPRQCIKKQRYYFLFIYFASKQLSLLFAQGQLLQALRPQDFQKGWGWGESPCLPGAACPILLPAGDGRVDKVYPCTIKYLSFVCLSVAQSYPTLATPWTVDHQAPLSKGFSRQEYWRGLPFPSPGKTKSFKVEREEVRK